MNFEKALHFHEQETLLTDSLSIFRVKRAIDINNMLSKKEEELAEESLQKEIKEKKLKVQYLLNSSLVVSSIIGTLLIGFLIRGHRRISRQNREINEKTQELVEANQNLAKSNEELGRFAHITSHDLKSPIRNIVSYTGLLRLKMAKDTNPKTDELLSFIENSGKRMNQLIDDVLEYSKLSGTSAKEKEVINLHSMLEEIIKLTNPNTNNVILNLGPVPHIQWYPSRIFLLFKNLVENGLKYNQSKSPTISISYEEISGIHTIYVKDNGIGIDEEDFDKIFILFNRLHTQAKYEGTGLGLATCKKIVNEFEGEISVESEINVGTTFKIELPASMVVQESEVLSI